MKRYIECKLTYKVKKKKIKKRIKVGEYQLMEELIIITMMFTACRYKVGNDDLAYDRPSQFVDSLIARGGHL